MSNHQSPITNIQSQLESVYPKDEAETLAWWIVEEETGLSRSQILSGCKGTTNFSKLQDFCEKNDLCLHKNSFVAQKACSSQDNANVASGEDCRQSSCEAKNACNQAESEVTIKIQEIIERLLHFEPIQYIFGHTLWCGLDLKVTPATLIPRPETAELVKVIGERQKAKVPLATNHSPLAVLDIGTGSGCIALALKKAHPEWQVTGIDISPEAIEVARENATRNNLDVDFEVADIFNDQSPIINHLTVSPINGETLDGRGTNHLTVSPINGETLDGRGTNDQSPITNHQYDVVVSNPPYICESEKVSMNSNVLDYEPHTALFVPDSDPLRFYRRIASLASNHSPLAIFFEINEHFPDEIETLLHSLGYENIRIHRDIYGKPRIAEGTLLSDV